MSTALLLLITGIGLGAIYFLVASGLSLIYGLMGVLNFAHGVFLSLGAFLGYEVATRMGTSTWGGFAVSLLVGALAGAVFAATPGPQCGTCQVKDSCPAYAEGRRL